MPNPLDVVEAFRAAMAEAGVRPAEGERIIPDGKKNRCRADHDGRGKTSVQYVLHADDPPNGWFEDFKRGLYVKWKMNGHSPSSPAERRRYDAARLEREHAELLERRERWQRAARRWELPGTVEADPAHPYLLRKGVGAHGIRQSGGALLVPVRSAEGELRGVQRVRPNGDKRFVAGSAVRGCFHLIGGEPEPGGVLLVAEGYATAATLHEATGHPVAVAFNCGNLLPVARALRAKYSGGRLLIAGDDDRRPENPGRTKATAAGEAVGASVALPPFAEGEDGTDWNDYAAAHGAEAVAERVAAALAEGPEPAAEAPTFASLADLLERPDLLEPPECVVPRLAYRGRLVILAGPDKSGKSTLMAHAAAALTRGEPFLSAPTGTRHGTAVLMGLEEAVGDAVQRFAALNADPTRVQLVVTPQTDLLERTRALLAEWPADLLVIDSLSEYARVTCGSVPDDGDNAGWAGVVRPLVALARERDVAVVVLHHVRRSDGQFRGAGEIAAAADALLELIPPGQSDDPSVRKVRGRGRWTVEPFAVALREGRYDLDGGGELSVDARVLIYVENQEDGATRTAIRSAVGGRASAVDAAMRRLEDADKIEKRRDGRFYIKAPF